MAETKINHDNYSDDDIQALEGLEAVRKRPGMYIGTTSSEGLHHLIWEIVDNGIDEALAGYANTICVSINDDDVVTVEDNGRGMPTGIHPKTKISTIETIFTVLHAGGKFGGGAYKVSGGLHGVGASVVNALSTSLSVEVKRENKIYYVSFENGGKLSSPLSVIGECEDDISGSKVTFKADPEIFKEGTNYDYEKLFARLRQYAFLSKGIKIIFNYKDKKEQTFLYENGIKEFVAYLNKGKDLLFDEIPYIDETDKETSIACEVSFQYNDSYNASIYSFCNNISTPEGGSHEEGFRMALSRVINNYVKNNNLLKKDEDSLTIDDMKEGLTAIISVKHPDPQYEGQTKSKLGSSDVKPVVSKLFGEYLNKFFLENPSIARRICEKAISASKARIAAKKAREATRRKNSLEISSLPGKLADCSSNDASVCEIYIVEGNSAGGSAKLGRDSNFQAILPLRGKVLNVEKAPLHKIFDNAEIRSMITAFGCNVGNDIDISKLRYHKIVIMTDADVDGAHICTLMLTFLYRYFRPVIEGGYVYIAMPPLYKVFYGNKTFGYCYSDEELNKLKNELADKRYDIQRYKGLGEMDPSQLWETTLDPETRTLKKVTISDAIEADQIFETLMGDVVEPRKDFIVENANFAKNLDI